jgi:hypothetical protein
MPRTCRRKKRQPGRPSKYKASTAKRICSGVARGYSREGAAALGGISKDTLFQWARRFPAFSAALERADAKFEAQCVKQISAAGKVKRNWCASAWLLERKHPGRWGRIDRVQVQHTEPAAIPLPEEYIGAILRALGCGQPLIPIRRPDSRPVIDVEAVPAAELPEHSAEDVRDSDGLPILPDPEDPKVKEMLGRQAPV